MWGWLCVCGGVGGCVCVGGWVFVHVAVLYGFVSLIFRKLSKPQFALMCGFCLLPSDM